MKRFYFFLLFICLNNFFLFAQCEIERWERYELSIPAKVKGNPFDVKVSATFIHADKEVTVAGFYDGMILLKYVSCPIGKVFGNMLHIVK